jgi:hypothetical protein
MEWAVHHNEMYVKSNTVLYGTFKHIQYKKVSRKRFIRNKGNYESERAVVTYTVTYLENKASPLPGSTSLL